MFTQSSQKFSSHQSHTSHYRKWLAPVVLCALVLSGLKVSPPATVAKASSAVSPALAPASLRINDALLAFARRYPNDMLSLIVQQDRPGTAVAELVHELHGEVTQELSLIHGLAVRLPGSAVARLAASPGVKWISQDAPIYKSSNDDGSVTLREDFDGSIYQTQAEDAPMWPSGPSWSSGAWQEIGENDGPNAGDIVIAPFLAGERIGARLQGVDKGLQTSFNLSDATQASLSLDFRRKDLSSVCRPAHLAAEDLPHCGFLRHLSALQREHRLDAGRPAPLLATLTHGLDVADDDARLAWLRALGVRGPATRGGKRRQ